MNKSTRNELYQAIVAASYDDNKLAWETTYTKGSLHGKLEGLVQGAYIAGMSSEDIREAIEHGQFNAAKG